MNSLDPLLSASQKAIPYMIEDINPMPLAHREPLAQRCENAARYIQAAQRQQA